MGLGEVFIQQCFKESCKEKEVVKSPSGGWRSWAGGDTTVTIPGSPEGHRLFILPGKDHFVWLNSIWYRGTSIFGIMSSKNINNPNNS